MTQEEQLRKYGVWVQRGQLRCTICVDKEDCTPNWVHNTQLARIKWDAEAGNELACEMLIELVKGRIGV